MGGKMAFRNLWSRNLLRDVDAPARLAALAWRCARWGWIFYRSKYRRGTDSQLLEGPYREMRERLFDERQLASEALYWATVRNQAETAYIASMHLPDATRPDDADAS